MVVKKLKQRIALTLIMILTLIMLGIQGFQHISNYLYIVDSMKILMEDVTERAVSLKEEYWYQPVWAFEIQGDNTLHLIQKSTGAVYNDQEILEKAEKILSLDKKDGRYEEFMFLHQNDTLVLADGSDMLEYYKSQTFFFLVSSCVGFFIIIGVSILIAGWLTKPTELAFEQQKQFVSDASHELKTPLAVIGANAQRLQSEIGENKWLNYILEESKRMNTLLKELLTLAKVEDESVKLTFETVNLSKIVTRALLPYESVAYEKEVDFWMDIQEGIYIQGEEEHLRQVMIILADNAFHHVSEYGEIRTKLSKKDKKIEISISNTGQEIPMEEQEKIFGRFYRGTKERGRTENRYGLGLSIAAGIVHRHEGRIAVVSKNGRTTFIIYL